MKLDCLFSKACSSTQTQCCRSLLFILTSKYTRSAIIIIVAECLYGVKAQKIGTYCLIALTTAIVFQSIF